MANSDPKTKKARDNGFEPGSYGCHEAMHVSFMFAEMVEKYLCDHPSIIGKPQWRKLADASAQNLQTLYQLISQEHCDD